jgi:putative ABC transport system permease protein
MNAMKHSPRVARALLRACLPADERGDSMLGDLEEEYERRAGRPARGLWYAVQAVRLSLGYGLWRRLRRRRRAAPARGGRGSGGLWLDLRHAARSLRRRPTYLLAGVATLALGIGADTAIFSVVYESVGRPLPFPRADGLLVLGDRGEADAPGPHSNMNVANFLDLRSATRAFTGMAAFEYGSFLVGGDLDPAHVTGLRVTEDFFDVLGRPPRVGRDFRADDDRPGASRVVILSDVLWRTRFGADPAIIGRTIALNLEPHTVVGIAAPDVTWRAEPQLWVPYAWPEEVRNDRRRRTIFAVGRLADGVTATAGIAELQSHFARIRETYPEPNQNRTVDGADLFEWTVGWGRHLMRLLAVAAGLVLLIACVNVANLMLARAEGRRGELAMRRALGAGRARAAWVFVSEGLLLGVLGGIAGIALAFAGVRLLVTAYGASIPRAEAVGVNSPALLIALGGASVTGLLVGLVPAAMLDALRERTGQLGGRVTRGGGRVQQGLVILEIALAVVIVAATGLLVNTALRLGSVDLGVEERGALTFRITLPGARYGAAGQGPAFLYSALDEMRALPGITAAGLGTRAPLSGGTNGNFTTPAQPDAQHLVEMRAVSPEWFDALGQRRVAGRLLDAADARSGVNVVVVNETLARTMFPDGDALGQQLHATFIEHPSTIVGVVSDVRDLGPMREPRATAYWPYGGDVLSATSMAVVVRTRGVPPASVLPAIRERLRALDPDVPLADVATLEDVAAATIGRDRRAALSLMAGFAVLALILAVLGIYAVVAFGVEERRREVGVRMALGATRTGVLRLVCGRGLRLAIGGIVLGLVGAALSSRLVAHLLWGVTPADPLTLLATALIFLTAAFAGSFLPARRASSFHVADILRQDG